MDQCGFVSPSETHQTSCKRSYPHRFLFLCERTRVAPFFDDDRIIRTYRTLEVGVSFVTGYGHLGKPLLVGLVLAGRADRGRRIFRAADALRPPGAIAVVFQNDRLMPWRTAIANVELGLEMLDVPKETRRDIPQHWLSKLGLNGHEKDYPHALSGGMRQRMSIARAFATDANLLLCNERFPRSMK